MMNRFVLGHEYPYAIKMKHIKASQGVSLLTNRSFDADDHSMVYPSQSSASLTSISTMNYHDFELRQREHVVGMCAYLLLSS
jgi:hypothetical protein